MYPAPYSFVNRCLYCSEFRVEWPRTEWVNGLREAKVIVFSLFFFCVDGPVTPNDEQSYKQSVENEIIYMISDTTVFELLGRRITDCVPKCYRRRNSWPMLNRLFVSSREADSHHWTMASSLNPEWSIVMTVVRAACSDVPGGEGCVSALDSAASETHNL